MSRTIRDMQRHIDHLYERYWRTKYYNQSDGTVGWGDRLWRRIIRYSQSRRKYFAAMKRMKRHLIAKNRKHNRLYGHHPLED